MTRRVSSRPRRACPNVAFVLLALFLFVPSRGVAAGPFPGYPASVRNLAQDVVDAAGPGKEEELGRKVRALREAMFRHGILSINAIPDAIFARAWKEGWKGEAGGALRAVTRVSPFSVSLWAWLIRDDLVRFEGPDRLFEDMRGFRGALRQYAPALLGCAAWLLFFVSAAACWFAVWSSISLFLRARPALISDISRGFKRLPRPEIFASLAVLLCFVGPVAAGMGLGVAAIFWFALSAGYLRRGELLIAMTAILLLAGVFLCGGVLRSIARLTGDTRHGSWLGGEGYFPQSWPETGAEAGDLLSGAGWSDMVKFARARAEMESGDLEKSETLWTQLIGEGGGTAATYNNRGIVRAWLGKKDEAVADFDAAVEKSPSGGPAHWNAYQMYLQLFRLERAARVQQSAWASLRHLAPFEFGPEELTHGELIPSPLPMANVWKNLFTLRGDELRESGRSAFQDLFFRPVPGNRVLLFLGAGWIWAALWKSLSRKLWMHSTCRSCGTRTLIVGSRETTDICNSCRAQVGSGVRGGEEREWRILTIRFHRRYVRACSVFFPGTGALWAGKDFRALIYGVLLSLPLGALTVSLGAGGSAHDLVSDMQSIVIGTALAGVALLWVFGAAWGWRSFDTLQLTYNLALERK